jgi:hypothetical protein
MEKIETTLKGAIDLENVLRSSFGPHPKENTCHIMVWKMLADAQL